VDVTDRKENTGKCSRMGWGAAGTRVSSLNDKDRGRTLVSDCKPTAGRRNGYIGLLQRYETRVITLSNVQNCLSATENQFCSTTLIVCDPGSVY
jgi:hypothetical protein